ncbi:choice-of-anchor P family protein [Klenkia sp. LSe6-5]|uniref:Choice-of-anchor P family protein n=1 Tax=Klenkia sesuvii TaxID=3103137 RepID=A0ABU8DY84_9ACTN
MTLTDLRRRAGTVTALATALVVLGAAPASADTASASATAASITLLGGSPASSGAVTATHDGETGSTTGNPAPALALLGSQTLITSGTLVQKAVANGDGTSAACSALVGAGGGVTIGADGSCLVAPGTGGVSLRLLGGALPVDVLADAISSRCTASSTGATTAASSLVNARVRTTTLTVPTVVPLASSPAVGAGLSVPGVATLLLNGQTAPQGAGSVQVAALSVSLLADGTRVDVATSTCGLNVATVAVPAVPLTGWTVVAGAVVAGWAVLAARWVRRRGVAVRTA